MLPRVFLFGLSLPLLAFALACSGFAAPTHSDVCRCTVEVPFGMSDAAEPLTGEHVAFHKANAIREQYFTIQSLPKAEFAEAVTTLTLLDRFTDSHRWLGPANGLDREGTRAVEVDGWPALSRHTWETLDGGVEIENVSILVDLPDRAVWLQGWALAEHPDRVDEMEEVLLGVRFDPPPRGQAWSSFPGVTPATTFAKAPREAREGHALELVAQPNRMPLPVTERLEPTTYPSPVGELHGWAALPAAPLNQTAVLWLTEEPTDVEEQATALFEAEVGVFVPSLRGRFDNPGEVERLWGEVDDVLAARAWLAEQPGVERIVLVAGWEMGTLALLTAAETDGFARVVVGAPPVDLVELHARYPGGYDPTEYAQSELAHQLRSPLHFADQLRSPVVYAWVDGAFATAGPFRMERAALEAGTPFELLALGQGEIRDLMPVLAEDIAARVTAGTLATAHTPAETLALAERVIERAEGRIEGSLTAWIENELALGYTPLAEVDAAAWEEGDTSLDVRGARLAQRLVAPALETHRAMMAAWPEHTEVDRLERAFATLDRAGIVARTHYSDCADCAWAHIRHIGSDRRASGQAILGYAFTSEQESWNAVRGDPLGISYGGWWDHDTTDIGKQVVAALDAEGLQVEWSGEPDDRIYVSLEWRRRPPDAR